MHIANDVTEVG